MIARRVALLTAVLDASGRSSPIGEGLPVAGKTGTLTTRFVGAPAAGRLRAKTGTLNTVTALAGFVDTVPGAQLTFAYVANGRFVSRELLQVQDDLATDLVRYPEGPSLAQLGPLSRWRTGGAVTELPMFPLGGVLFPSMVLPLHVFEPRYRALVRDCLDGDGEFGVVLIERGSEVGGDDVRTDVGTMAHILQAEELDDGRWVVAAVGTRRLRVRSWLPDDPYPRAAVDDWPDAPPASDLSRLYDDGQAAAPAGPGLEGRARRPGGSGADRALRRPCPRQLPAGSPSLRSGPPISRPCWSPTASRRASSWSGSLLAEEARFLEQRIMLG